MTVCTATFEAGVNGNNVLTTDPGSSTAWDVRHVDGGTLTYSNAQKKFGALSMLAAGAGSTKFMAWTTALGSITDHYGRFYLYTTDAALSNTYFFSCADGASNVALIRHMTTGSINIYTLSGQVGSSSLTLPLNQWVRFEYHLTNNAATGLFEVKIFTSSDSTTPAETLTATNTNTGTTTSEIDYGHDQGSDPPYSSYFDDIVAGATSYPGPVDTGALAPWLKTL